MVEPLSFIDVRHLSVDYQRPAGVFKKLLGKETGAQSVLRDITVSLGQGAHLTLFGMEGAGKTTLLRTLTGVLTPTSGVVRVNGVAPAQVKDVAAGYISPEESEPRVESVHDVLTAFGLTHQIKNLPARLTQISDILQLGPMLHNSAERLSTSQRLRVNIARAALSDAPLVLFDDVADILGVQTMRDILGSLFQGRTCIVATRFVVTAETLLLPILLLHNGVLVHTGTCDEIAGKLACPRELDVWIEGLRYDLLRKLRQHSGVHEVRLLPSSRFSGQKLRIRLHSAHYLPSIYDLVSQAPLVRVQELPASLADIIARLQ